MANSQIEIKELDTRIIKYRLADKKNGAVIYYTLDLDKYQLSIQGEVCGSYKWCETPESESFLELMARCDSGYLLNKLFTQTFDCELSIKAIKKVIKENFDFRYMDCRDSKWLMEEISGIDTDSEEMFAQKVSNILNQYNINLDSYEIWDCCEKSYQYWEKKAVSYFCNNIKPKLRKKIGEIQNGTI